MILGQKAEMPLPIVALGEGRERGHLQQARILPRAFGCVDAVQVGVEVEVLRDGLRLCHHIQIQHLERAGIRRH